MFEEKVGPVTMKEWLTAHELDIVVGADKEDGEYYAYIAGYDDMLTCSGETIEDAIDHLLGDVCTKLLLVR